MKIEVLYVPDCPHHPAAILKLKEVLAAEGGAARFGGVSELSGEGNLKHGRDQCRRQAVSGNVCNEDSHVFLVYDYEVIKITRHRVHRNVAGSNFQTLNLGSLARENG